MSTFVDTSALLAVLDGDDQNHGRAKAAWGVTPQRRTSGR